MLWQPQSAMANNRNEKKYSEGTSGFIDIYKYTKLFFALYSLQIGVFFPNLPEPKPKT
jgi:hypothetical protein